MARGGPRVGWRPGFRYGGVAQLVEHLLCKQGVIGSNPFASIFLRPCRGKVRRACPGDACFQNLSSGAGLLGGVPSAGG
jgi:hypothetical protein